MLIISACFHKFISYLTMMFPDINPNTDSLNTTLLATRFVKDHIRGPADGGFDALGTTGRPDKGWPAMP